MTVTCKCPDGNDAAPNEKGLAHCREVFETCREYGTEPLVTIHHFDDPPAAATVYGSVHDLYDCRREHIRQTGLALRDGMNLIGCTARGCIDIVSAGTGEMKKRCGCICVDKDNDGKGTLDRSLKDSCYWYQKVIASNGTSLD